jgi:uncharacterized protein (TIGR03663 family)
MPAALLPLLILILLRLVLLDARPIHHDEAVNGWFIDGIFQKGFFSYDPNNYHGPLFFYWTALAEILFGRSLTALRIPSVLFGSLLTLVPLLFRRWIGLPAALLASYLLAISPAMVFFSRYAIHETAFVFFEALFFVFWLNIGERGWSWRRAVGLGLALGAMAGLKENFVIFGAAVLLSEAALRALTGNGNAGLHPRQWRFFLGVSGVATVLIVLTFTGMFQDRAGVGKFFDAFVSWTRTGTEGNGHEKPFWYWTSLMARFEWPALLGLVVLLSGFRGLPRALQSLGLTGGGLFLIYSIVRYKTPWCLLSFSWAFTIPGAFRLMQWIQGRWRIPALILLTGGGISSLWLALDAAYLRPDQDGHPYIYGQTYSDLIPPVEKILERSRSRPVDGEPIRVQVVSRVTWPLPYLLGELKKVGYFTEANAPAVLDGDVVVLDENLIGSFSSRFSGKYQKDCFRSRQWASRMCFFHRSPDEPAGR